MIDAQDSVLIMTTKANALLQGPHVLFVSQAAGECRACVQLVGYHTALFRSRRIKPWVLHKLLLAVPAFLFVEPIRRLP